MESFDHLVEIVARLRAPDGCPWDKVQTRDSIKKCLVEETGELLDAIEDIDTEEMREEIGDVLLQAIFHSQLAAEEGRFNIDDVLKAECDKLIYRHPHVFGDNKAKSAEDALSRWEAQKAADKNLQAKRQSVMDGVARNIPALSRARKVLDKAQKAGRPWRDENGILQQLNQDIAQLQKEITGNGSLNLEDSISALLFSLTALARLNGLEAEELLQKKIKEVIADFNSQQE